MSFHRPFYLSNYFLIEIGPNFLSKCLSVHICSSQSSCSGTWLWLYSTWWPGVWSSFYCLSHTYHCLRSCVELRSATSSTPGGTLARWRSSGDPGTYRSTAGVSSISTSRWWSSNWEQSSARFPCSWCRHSCTSISSAVPSGYLDTSPLSPSSPSFPFANFPTGFGTGEMTILSLTRKEIFFRAAE